MEQNGIQPVLTVTDLVKTYRLGQVDADTLQEELKLWWRGRGKPGAGAHRHIENETLYALNGVNLVVYPGERLGIIGRNGAGKSTLLKLISRITAPTAGRIRVRGRVASMLEVGTGFHGDMTGRENVYLNGAILGMTRAEIDRKMEAIIAFSELRDFIDTPVKRYSSGMYVKLGFAVAAHLDSEIMIMDEVLAVGDMAYQHKCLKRMRDAALNENRTILYVSHNMNSVRSLCSRCVVLDEGRIVFDGDPDRAIAVYLGTDQAAQRRTVFDGAYRPYDRWIRLNPRMNIDSLEILKDRPSFRAGERAAFTVSCTAFQPLSGVGFRLEFWSGDGVKIGTMLAGSFTDLSPGENRIRVEMDTSHLTAGQYRADLVAYLHDADGNEDILDGVYPGLVCEITAPLDAEQYLDWHHKYWGSIRLHDLQLREERP